jgi:hypothetical protein
MQKKKSRNILTGEHVLPPTVADAVLEQPALPLTVTLYVPGERLVGF